MDSELLSLLHANSRPAPGIVPDAEGPQRADRGAHRRHERRGCFQRLSEKKRSEFQAAANRLPREGPHRFQAHLTPQRLPAANPPPAMNPTPANRINRRTARAGLRPSARLTFELVPAYSAKSLRQARELFV